MIDRASPMHTMRHMNNMMNSLFTDPFEMMGQNALMPHRGRNHNDMLLSPFDQHFTRYGFVSRILNVVLIWHK